MLTETKFSLTYKAIIHLPVSSVSGKQQGGSPVRNHSLTLNVACQIVLEHTSFSRLHTQIIAWNCKK